MVRGEQFCREGFSDQIKTELCGNLLGYIYTYVSDVISKKKTKECINQALPAIVWRKGSGHSSMNICWLSVGSGTGSTCNVEEPKQRKHGWGMSKDNQG